MRPVNWGRSIEALAMILERPFAERGYEQLMRYYEQAGMSGEAEAVGFLIKERFHADGSDASEGQRDDGSKGDQVPS
jgi:DNA-binding SARP family transcriptional activator